MEEIPKGVGKVPKKLDKLPDPEDAIELAPGTPPFKPASSVTERVAQFKASAIETMKSKRWPNLRIAIADLEKYFGFQVDSNAYSWMPRRFIDEFKRQGINIRKVRGRTFAFITISDKHEKNGPDQ